MHNTSFCQIQSLRRQNIAYPHEVRDDYQIDEIHPNGKAVSDNLGQTYHYGKMFLVTGGIPKHLKYNIPNLIYFKFLGDNNHVRE